MKYYYFFAVLISFYFAANAHAATALNVPFTPQSPSGEWVQPWQDACEESVIAMIDSFYHAESLERQYAEKKIQNIFLIKEHFLGYSLDEGADTIVSFINNFLTWEAYVVEAPTIEEITHEMSLGRPVILPTYGRALKNPYFRAGGPNYHTIVISGFDDETQEFITQEPGTQFGLDYRYPYARLMEAMHDFVPGRYTETGRKVAIFTRRQADISATTDGDRDGLSKEEELLHRTKLFHGDSDGDGYSDGVEIEFGYSPLVHEQTLPLGALVKERYDPRVYLLSSAGKQHILTEAAFLGHNWVWSDIIEVGPTYLDGLKNGPSIS